MDRHVVISGCSGGGKSTLLTELAGRGYAVVEEPGRRILKEELAGAGSALPWVDLAAFAQRAFDLALDDRRGAMAEPNWVFFDRGLIDAAVALEHAGGAPAATQLGQIPPYHRRAFLAPPWPEIYRRDDERRHGLAEAMAEYERLAVAYPRLGYEVIILPQVSIEDRATFLLACLED